MLRHLSRLSIIAIACLGIVAPAHAQNEPLKLAVTDLVGLEELQREFGAFRAKLEEVTGQKIEFTPVTNRTAAIEALRFKKVDLVMTGPAEYVVMNKRANAKLVVGLSRPDYFAVIVAMADSPYSTAADLKGKKIAVGSVGSTSRHLGPLQALADAGLNPQKDVQVTHTTGAVGWLSLKRGDIAAVGMNNTDYLKLREKEAKEGGLQPGAFRVIARGPDLPNDMLMAGAHVSEATIAKFRNAFTQHSDALIATVLKGQDNQKYQGMRFITSISDKHYNYVRSMYATVGYPEYSNIIGE